MKKTNATKKGFTLIETLVAISILMLSITGPLVFATQGLKASVYARDQVTAFYLAQDAIETLRHLRDNTAIQLQLGLPAQWDQMFSKCYPDTPDQIRKCKIDSTVVITDPTVDSNVVEICTDDNSCRLSQHKTLGAYSHRLPDADNWSTTRYIRSLTIKKVNDDEVTIAVEIKWNTGLINRSFIARENMFNIYGEI